MRSLAQALIKYERIQTTLPKAKEAQRLAERLITLGKKGGLSSHRKAMSLLNDAQLVGRLFAEVAPRFAHRPGGYTRILRLHQRHGDGASLALLELVEKTLPTKVRPKEKERGAERAPEKPEKKPRRVQPQVAEEVKPPEPTKAEPKPAEEPKPLKEKKPEGFFEGLRKFFKGRPKK